MSKSDSGDRAVVVTTANRGVFFGYVVDASGKAGIRLRAARLCVYWPPGTKGFMGLAAVGPPDGSRVGPPADLELRNVTAVVECTPEAVIKWEAAPWKE